MLEDLGHAPQKITYSQNEFENNFLRQFVNPCDISITEINSILYN